MMMKGKSWRWRRGKTCLAPTITLIALLLALSHIVYAQTTAPIYQVFLLRNVDESGLDRLIFIDTLTGEETTAEVYGERYTIAGDNVLFLDTSSRAVRLVSANGVVRDHPFIHTDSQTYRIDWVVSQDNSLI